MATATLSRLAAGPKETELCEHWHEGADLDTVPELSPAVLMR